jgi:hypothetical protein
MKGAVAGVSGLAAVVLLLPMEAGIPVPLPADLVMFTVGERVGAGQFPLWLAGATPDPPPAQRCAGESHPHPFGMKLTWIIPNGCVLRLSRRPLLRLL